MNIIHKFNQNDILQFKKTHPCGGDMWKVIKFGVECKLECTTCQRQINLSRVEIYKRIKKVVTSE